MVGWCCGMVEWSGSERVVWWDGVVEWLSGVVQNG